MHRELYRWKNFHCIYAAHGPARAIRMRDEYIINKKNEKKFVRYARCCRNICLSIIRIKRNSYEKIGFNLPLFSVRPNLSSTRD